MPFSAQATTSHLGCSGLAATRNREGTELGGGEKKVWDKPKDPGFVTQLHYMMAEDDENNLMKDKYSLLVSYLLRQGYDEYEMARFGQAGYHCFVVIRGKEYRCKGFQIYTRK